MKVFRIQRTGHGYLRSPPVRKGSASTNLFTHTAGTPDLRIALDITAEYKAASGTGSDLPMGCIIVQKVYK